MLRWPRHSFDCLIYGIVDPGKLSDIHHVEDFLKMIRKSRNSGNLVILIGFGQYLDKECNAAAIDIRVLFKLKKYFARALIIRVGVSIIEKGFREGGHIPHDVKERNITDRFQSNFSLLSHRCRYLSVIGDR